MNDDIGNKLERVILAIGWFGFAFAIGFIVASYL